jgi:ubiquinone biosynthesis protein
MNILNLWRFRHTYRNVNRLSQIVNIFIKHGFGRFVEQVNLQRFIPFGKRLTAFGYWPYPEKSNMPVRLRIVFSELGPAFIKLGQLLSSRPDLITLPYTDEFKKLLDKAPPFPFESARSIIETEFNAPIEEIFMDFEETPIAAASISQVHRGILKDGSPVIIKVQRPGIKEIIETDLDVLRIFARLMVKYVPDISFVNPVGIVEEFSKSIRKELRFTLEAKNVERFKRKCSEKSYVYVPIVYEHLVTDKVFVMERLEGVRIDDIDALDDKGHNRRRLAHVIAEAYFRQIFEFGFFHADPHPGNLIVLKDGTVGLIDYGMVGNITPELMDNIADTLIAFVRQDFDGLVDQYEKLGLSTGKVDTDFLRNEFKADLMELLNPLYTLSLGQIDLADFMEDILHLAAKHGLQIPRDLILVNKTLIFLEHLGRRLDPDFHVIEIAKPYAVKLIKRKFDPVKIAEKARKNVQNLSDLLQTAPQQLRIIMRKIIGDHLTINIEHNDFDRFKRDHERSLNRLSLSIVVAAMLISSSIVVYAELSAKILSFPIFGVLSFIVSFIVGFVLFFSFLRTGGL